MSRYADYLRTKALPNRLTEFHSGENHDQKSHGNWANGIAAVDDKDVVVSGQRLGTAVPKAKTSKGQEGAGALDAEGHRRMGIDLIPDSFVKKTIDRQALVPGFEEFAGRTDRAALQEIVERQAQNIEDVYEIANRIGQDTIEAHAGWYPWVNKYSQVLAEKYGMDPNGVMAAMAVLSPSQAWPSNVAWGKAVIEFVNNEKNIIVQPEWLVSAYEAKLASWKTSKAAIEAEGREYGVPKPTAESINALVGKTVADLSPEDAAVVLRGAHENFGKAVRELGGGPGLGDPANIAKPQSYENFAKAISVLRDSSASNISTQLGENHKVRSFYENIRNPHDRVNSEVTVDSHHVGLANGLPITGGNPLVPAGAFNNKKPKPLIKIIYDGPKVAATGMVGTYPLVVEATRLATERINKKYGTNFTPNQIQSVTWETWRGLYPSRARSATRLERIAEARRAYSKGPKTARAKALMLATIEDARLDAKLGPKGPSLEDVRKGFLKELDKGKKK